MNLAEILKEEMPGNNPEDKLEGLATLFVLNERADASRITGYVEEIVENIRDTSGFKRNFRLNTEMYFPVAPGADSYPVAINWFWGRKKIGY